MRIRWGGGVVCRLRRPVGAVVGVVGWDAVMLGVDLRRQLTLGSSSGSGTVPQCVTTVYIASGHGLTHSDKDMMMKRTKVHSLDSIAYEYVEVISNTNNKQTNIQMHVRRMHVSNLSMRKANIGESNPRNNSITTLNQTKPLYSVALKRKKKKHSIVSRYTSLPLSRG